ncbi:hypothetical protein QTO34_000100 [Cnephaeus nilssonii]|uniref:ASD2 domain-containing protein n=1 Tax=Cnephaeus nilssonii TaxID=3371016 RepID=A0AA40LU40_CNENI|nr:hypothetical protein QTO34_000100 [Eptesicus nilssonii]
MLQPMSHTSQGSKHFQKRKEPTYILLTTCYASNSVPDALRILSNLYNNLARRNAPVSRPHSWHVAKLLEGCPEAATTMHVPSEAFSLSWHSGCNTSDVCVQWCPLSRHCSTEKSSSIGSMESLEQPGQATYEGHLLPIDQNMYPNQRDSAYSSFSASSNASDCALSLRPEEPASTDCIMQGPGLTKTPNGRPNVAETSGGSRRTNGGQLTSSSQMSSRPQEVHHSGPAKAAKGPPQPPVRRDSLQTSRAQLLNGEQRRASEPMDSLQQKEKPSLDTELCPRNPHRVCCLSGQDQVTNEDHQNCELSQPPESNQQGSEHLLMEASSKAAGFQKSYDSSPHSKASAEIAKTSSFGSPSRLTGPIGHRHSAPEQLLASHLQHVHLDTRSSQGMELPTGQDGHEWTLSPLHNIHTGKKSPCPPIGGAQDQPSKERKTRPVDDRSMGSGHQRPSSSPHEEADGHPPERRFQDPNRVSRAGNELPSQQPSASGSLVQQTRDCSSTTKVAGTTEATEEGDNKPKECSRVGGRRNGGTRGRSIQNRRKSERFATNLRNEIQRRKAQLHKSKSPLSQLCDTKEQVEEAEEPLESPLLPASNSPLLPSYEKPPSPRDKLFNKNMMLRARSSECLSQAPESHECRIGLEGRMSPSQKPGQSSLGLNTWWKASDSSSSDSEKTSVHRGVYGSHWRWSPEHNLQPHVALATESSSSPGDNKELKASTAQAGEEAILLPFADRRKFFEENSKSLSTSHLPGERENLLHCLGPPIQGLIEVEFPGDKWKPVTGNRKTSQSGREMAHSKADFSWATPFHPCLENPALDLSSYRAISSLDLLGDFKHSSKKTEETSVYEEESSMASMPHPLRSRAFSESHISLDPQSSRAWGQPRRELFTKVDETQLDPLGTRKKAFPPPRPPPPNWEKYRLFRAAQQQQQQQKQQQQQQEEEGEEEEEEEEEGVEEDEEEEEEGGEEEELPPQYFSSETTGSCALNTEEVLEQPQPLDFGHLEVSRQGTQSLPAEQESFTLHSSDYMPPIRGHLGSQPEKAQPPCYYGIGGLWRTSEQETTDPSKPESLMAEDSKPKPAWSQSYLFPEEQLSFMGWRSEKQHLSPVGFSELKTTGSAATLVKPLGATGSISPPYNSATMEEAGAIGDTPEVERCYSFSGRRPALQQAVSEELMRDVVGRDKSLAGVLTPASNMVTTAEVMGDLFAVGDLQWRGHLKQKLYHQERRNYRNVQESHRVPLQEFQHFSPPQGAPGISTSYSAYYNISVAKAELLNKLKDQPEMAEIGLGEEEVDNELAQKKIQLIESIGRKLSVLREAQRGLLEDINANSALGEEVEANLKAVCKSNEFEKYRLFIGDLDKVVNLLLSLSGRLARVENALNSIDSEADQEKLVLMEKKQQLTGQLADAKELKEHMDRREKLVFGMVSRYLPQDQLQDYQHFVKMKSALIIEQRELEEKIKLGEEQLKCLRESLLLGPSNF